MSEPHVPLPRTFDLATPGGLKRLRSRGVHRLTMAPSEIVVEHGGSLRAPLSFAPGSVVLATCDPGPAQVPKGSTRGRFPILHRLSKTAVVPFSEGVDGWLWTSEDGAALTVLGDEAPNVAFLFTPPLAGALVEDAFEPQLLAELAKRSPHGEPAVFGLLLRVERVEEVREELTRLSLAGVLTDRDVPPVQRRHLPTDKPANPAITGGGPRREGTSMPPPGFGGS